MYKKFVTKPLKERVYNYLLELIIDQKLKSGDFLPPERVLCEEMGISRTVLREAINSLETRGVLTSLQGKGVKVNPVTSSDISHAFILYLKRKHQNISSKELLEIRCLIEPEFAGVVAVNHTKQDIDHLNNIIKSIQNTRDNREELNKIDLEFHLALARMSKNNLYITIIEALIIPIEENIIQSTDVNRDIMSHSEVVKQIESCDFDKAKKAMCRCLDCPKCY